MKTMEKLLSQFNRNHRNHRAELDTINSYKGYYRICISSFYPFSLSSTYTFYTCKEFSDWMKGVVLDD